MKCCKSFSDLCFLSWLLDKKQTHDIKIHTYRLLTYSPRRTGWMDISNLAFSRVSKTWRLTLSQGFFLIKFPLFSAWLGGWGQGINQLTPWLGWINGEKQWMKRASESYQFNLCIYSPSFLLWESPPPRKLYQLSYHPHVIILLYCGGLGDVPADSYPDTYFHCALCSSFETSESTMLLKQPITCDLVPHSGKLSGLLN